MVASVVLGALMQALPFAGGGWEVRGEAAVETFEGRDVLRTDGGWAYRRDVRFADGVIDVDVRLTRRRSFVYLAFRMQDDRDYEEVYLRPHKSELPDAVQYAPVYQGQSAWQLHHGPGKTASVRFDPDRWTKVRLVVKGRRAALYVDDMEKPALVVPDLARDPKPGFIALRAFVPPGTPGREPVARFANVRVQPGPPAVDIDALPGAPMTEDASRVRQWRLARAPAWPDGAGMPVAPTVGADATVVEARPNGLVEVHRYLKLPAEGSRLAAVARIHVRAERAGLRAFDLGFSDRAVVFVNGSPVFRGEASYSYAGRREGLIGFDQAGLYLPLRAGDNTVVVALEDSFGGMGIMGRFPDGAGLRVEAR